jgi:aromatic-L-amino-acid decarboxylase
MASTDRLHGEQSDIGSLPRLATDWMSARLDHSPVGRLGDHAALEHGLTGSIGDEGLGVDAAWQRFTDVVVPNTLGLDSERFLAFIPVSPSAAAVWMDAVVSAANFSAESWLEAAGAVAAEREVIELLCREAGMPAGSSGCFMSGGSIGNLSALAVARERAGQRRVVAVADTAHASVDNALYLLGLEALVVPTGPSCRLTAEALRAALGSRRDVGIVVASGGSTNAGVVDDLAGCVDVAAELDAWMHVDGAYGLAAMLLPEQRHRFAGIERADSFIVDPHKWLFAPAGSCALVYRRPDLARQVHTQRGPYIDVLHTADELYNPSDLGFQLTRRASGMPLWFALAVHGLEAHRRAIRVGIELAQAMAEAIEACPVAELAVAPELGVVLFRRHGWGAPEWRDWSTRLLEAQVAFVAPTTLHGEPVGRLVFMHPRTPRSIVAELIASLQA